MRLLMIEDNQQLAGLTAGALRTKGYVVDVVGTVEEADAAVQTVRYGVVLVDRKLPDGDGLTWLRGFRSRGASTPAIMLSATKNLVQDRVQGLNEGADDYLVKPFHVDELLARIRVLLRRPGEISHSVVDVGNLSFDLESHEVRIEGEPLSIARREASLLSCLVRRAGRVVPRSVLEQSLYSFDEEVSANAIDVSVYRLRAQLSGSGATVGIRTVRGVGYMLHDASSAAV